ncbi:MAG TPA: histidine kinase [Microbacterium sp.]|nr:histidine kinase [Microbacterium sp.]
MTAPLPQRVPIARPLPLAGAVAHLFALAWVGPLVIGALVAILGTSLALLPVLGIGALGLIVFAYAVFGIGWLETARIAGLYGVALPARRPRRSHRTGFVGFLHTVWLQLIDPASWRAFANFAIATALGWTALAALALAAAGIVGAFAPLFADTPAVSLGRTDIELPVAWAPVAGVLIALLALAAIVGLAVLHGIISRAIMVPSREQHFAEAAQASSTQRAGAVRAAEVERTRIERDLHDGIQPRLVSVGMTLGLAQQKVDDDPAAAKALIAEAHTSTKAAITELRQLARGIHASVLEDRGLDAALSALAARSHIPVLLDVRLTGRCSAVAEAAVYFVIAESLTNAAKHSRASEVRVLVRERDGGALWARVEDNGIGSARVTPGGGLDGISNRVIAAGGTFRLDSPVGGPTQVEVSVPCAS